MDSESDMPSKSEANVSCRSFAKSRWCAGRSKGTGESRVLLTWEGAGGEVSLALVGVRGGRAVRVGLDGGKSGVESDVPLGEEGGE